MKSLLIFRGLPGSGKTTLARLLAGNEWPVFSVDDYFTDQVTGAYNFNFEKNHLAYEQCLRSTESAMRAGKGKIFLDNTFTLEWEMELYFKLAEEHGYRVFVSTVENRHHGKNEHGISEDQVKKMSEKYRVILL